MLASKFDDRMLQNYTTLPSLLGISEAFHRRSEVQFGGKTQSSFRGR